MGEANRRRAASQAEFDSTKVNSGPIYDQAVEAVAEQLGLTPEEVKRRFTVRVCEGHGSNLMVTQEEAIKDPDRPVILVTYEKPRLLEQMRESPKHDIALKTGELVLGQIGTDAQNSRVIWASPTELDNRGTLLVMETYESTIERYASRGGWECPCCGHRFKDNEVPDNFVAVVPEGNKSCGMIAICDSCALPLAMEKSLKTAVCRMIASRTPERVFIPRVAGHA